MADLNPLEPYEEPHKILVPILKLFFLSLFLNLTEWNFCRNKKSTNCFLKLYVLQEK